MIIKIIGYIFLALVILYCGLSVAGLIMQVVRKKKKKKQNLINATPPETSENGDVNIKKED